MRLLRLTLIAVTLLGAGFGLAQADGPKTKRCTSPLAATGKDWQEFVHSGGSKPGVFYAQTNCPANYHPVSGGIRYEGAWNDTSLTFKWKEIASLPYDELADQEATAWRCMVLRTPQAMKDERPDALWCQAVCCRWD